MKGRSWAVQVGIFVTLGLALFAVGLFLIGDRRLLFVPFHELETSFTKVTGVQVGTKIRVGGLDAGEVTAILIPPRPSMPFVVRFRVRDDLIHLVRTDSVAAIQTDGIVGNAFIQIGSGTDEAPAAQAGSRIPGKDPVEFGEVVAQATAALESFHEMIDTLSGEISTTVTRLNETVDGVNEVIETVNTSVTDISRTVKASVDEAQGLVANARQIVQGVRDGEGSIGRLLTDEALYQDVKSATALVVDSAKDVRGATEATRRAAERLLGPEGPVSNLVAELQGAADSAEEVLSDLAENSEALKRNWLLRGFFQRRGFFDIDALTPGEYRQFSGEVDKRTALRLWIEADAIFRTGDDGEPVLTAEGRARIDLAMGTFLEYRRDSPLVVEGYATGGTTSAQFLESETRARLVRDHIVRRFRRDASLTGRIGLGAVALGNPSGATTWDGVALALHIPE